MVLTSEPFTINALAGVGINQTLYTVPTGKQIILHSIHFYFVKDTHTLTMISIQRPTTEAGTIYSQMLINRTPTVHWVNYPCLPVEGESDIRNPVLQENDFLWFYMALTALETIVVTGMIVYDLIDLVKKDLPTKVAGKIPERIGWK